MRPFTLCFCYTYSIHIVSLFFLTEQQEKVFRHLHDEPLSVTQVAKEVRLPRTSVAKALSRLEEIGLVEGRKVREKNKHLYRRISDDDLHKKIEELKSVIFKKPKVTTKVITHLSDSPITFYQGKDAVLSSLHDMLLLRRSERLYVLQGKDAPMSWVTFLGEGSVLDLHKKIIDNEIILVSVRSESVKGIINARENLKKSFEGRLSMPHTISDDFFEEGVTIYAFRNTLLLVNLKKGFSIRLHDKELTSGIIKIFSFMLKTSARDTQGV